MINLASYLPPIDFGAPLADATSILSGTDSFISQTAKMTPGYNACVELCDRHAASRRTALRWAGVDNRVETLTFRELSERAGRFARMLIELGAQPGDRVAGLLPRHPDLLTTILGTFRAGCVYQPIFTAFGPAAIASRLASSRPVLLVTDTANRAKLKGLAVPRTIISDGDRDDPTSMGNALGSCSTTLPPVLLPADAPFIMMSTSGTTGTPKPLTVPLHMLRAISAYMRFGIGLRGEDRFWNLADPGWAYGLYYGIIGPLLLGQAVTLSAEPFAVERCYELIRRFRITSLAGPPTAYRAMAASAAEPPRRLRAISSAGEPLDRQTAWWLERAFGCPARDHWGQTELGMVICDHHGLEQPRRPEGMGYAMPGWQVSVLDAAGDVQAAGEPGELAVDRRSPLFWFGGYQGGHSQPFRGDYYLTGDSAVREADGCLRFVGRDDDVITSAGYRIGPAEVEAELMSHPAVAEAAVVGKPDPARTEIVKAFITLVPEVSASQALKEELAEHVKRRLSAHAYPREIAFLHELPKTPSGKIRRADLRALA